MPAYVIANIEVIDAEGYERYKTMAGDALGAYGGRFLARGGEAEALEGDWSPKRVVVLEFESLARARAWWASPEYAEAKRLRRQTARTQMLVVEGR